MFDLVADIERYPEFLPGWTHARITAHEGDVLTVMQVIELGMLRLEFESHAQLCRPERLQVRSSTGPFRELLIDWRFTPDSPDSSMVKLTVSIEMHSVLLEAASGTLLKLLTQDVFQRFRERAAVLYGT